MATLNSGFSTSPSTPDKLTQEERDLIREFIAKKGITVLQPAAAASNEASRSTNELIAKKRKEFRQKQRGKTKG